MVLPSWLLVFLGSRRSQRPGPSSTLGSLGPSHHRRHKSRMSLQGPTCAHGVSGTPHGEVHDNGNHHPQKTQGVENNAIGCITRLSTGPSRLHRLIATIGYRWSFPLWFLLSCMVDLDMFLLLTCGCKHGKVDNSWSLLRFKWKWSKTIY
jgi:hypothetical protein